MNSARRHRYLCSLASGWAVAWLALAGFAQEPAPVEVLLREVARRHATNQEAVVTWQGSGTWTASSDSAGPSPAAAARLQFALDRRIHRQTYRLDPVLAATTGAAPGSQQTTDVPNTTHGGLLTAQWVFQSNERGSDSRDPRWQIDDAQRFQFSPELRTFFPEMLLACGERPAADLWRLLLPAGPAERPTESLAAGDVLATQEGSLVRIAKSNPILREQATVWTFDLAQGAQLVRLEQAGPHWTTVWDYAYAAVDGVWLPKSIRFSVELPAAAANLPPGDPAAVPPRSWALQIETESLNQLDGAERLRAEFLPLAAGELILDLRSGQRFQFGSGVVPSRDPPSSTETVAARATSAWRWLLVVGGLIVLAVGLVVNLWQYLAVRAGSGRVAWPWGPLGIACASTALVAAAAWQRSTELQQVAEVESQRTQSGHRCLFRLLRRQGIPSAMDAVLEKLSPGREPGLAEMIAYLQGIGLPAVSRDLDFAAREQLRTPAIVPVAAPRQYLFVDRARAGN